MTVALVCLMAHLQAGPLARGPPLPARSEAPAAVAPEVKPDQELLRDLQFLQFLQMDDEAEWLVP